MTTTTSFKILKPVPLKPVYSRFNREFSLSIASLEHKGEELWLVATYDKHKRLIDVSLSDDTKDRVHYPYPHKAEDFLQVLDAIGGVDSFQPTKKFVDLHYTSKKITDYSLGYEENKPLPVTLELRSAGGYFIPSVHKTSLTIRRDIQFYRNLIEEVNMYLKELNLKASLTKNLLGR